MHDSRSRAWLSQAENDAGYARYSMDGGFYAQACYAAQQAVEKAMKALLLYSGRDTGRTHSIVGLRKALSEAGIDIPDSILSLSEAQELTRLNIETRYPLGDAEEAPFELFGLDLAQRVVVVADRVVAMARGMLA